MGIRSCVRLGEFLNLRGIVAVDAVESSRVKSCCKRLLPVSKPLHRCHPVLEQVAPAWRRAVVAHSGCHGHQTPAWKGEWDQCERFCTKGGPRLRAHKRSSGSGSSLPRTSRKDPSWPRFFSCNMLCDFLSKTLRTEEPHSNIWASHRISCIRIVSPIILCTAHKRNTLFFKAQA